MSGPDHIQLGMSFPTQPIIYAGSARDESPSQTIFVGQIRKGLNIQYHSMIVQWVSGSDEI